MKALALALILLICVDYGEFIGYVFLKVNSTDNTVQDSSSVLPPNSSVNFRHGNNTGYDFLKINSTNSIQFNSSFPAENSSSYLGSDRLDEDLLSEIFQPIEYASPVNSTDNKYTIQSRSSFESEVTPPTFHYINLDDDEFLKDNDNDTDDDLGPIINFQPGDFIYPNSDTSTTTQKPTSTTNKPISTTPKPVTTEKTTSNKDNTNDADDDLGPVINFLPGDFIDPLSPEIPSTPSTDGSTDDGHEEDDGDKEEDEEISTEPYVSSEWDENHPCNYGNLTHNIVVERAGRRVSDIQCEYNMWDYKYKVLEAKRKEIECAQMESLSGVIGGSKATQGEFPHMGAVGFKALVGGWIFMCGSSLISTRFAITAAHCSAITADRARSTGLVGTRPDVVRFGSVYIISESNTNNLVNFMDIQIDGDIMVLPKYLFGVKYNDIALIRLIEDVTVISDLRPACLWNGDLGNRIVANVSGWGATSGNRKNTMSASLLYAEINIVERDTCIRNLRGRVVWKGLTEHQFCAGRSEGQVDTCQGDSGGPIQIQAPLPAHIDHSGLMYHVLGVTSFGVQCGRRNLPGVYVNVSDHNILCWIEKTVWPDEQNDHCSEELFQGYEI